MAPTRYGYARGWKPASLGCEDWFELITIRSTALKHAIRLKMATMEDFPDV